MIQTLLDLEPFNRHTAFTLWKLCSHDPRTNKPYKNPRKLPFHYDGRTLHSTAKPAQPLTAEQAAQWLAYNRSTGIGHGRMGEPGFIGVGFRPEGTGLACLDIDNCLEGDVWNKTALDMFKLFPGALVERSQSRKGAHVWFSYTGEGPGKLTKDEVIGALELYSEGQYIAAGDVLHGDASIDHSGAMRALMEKYWPPRAAKANRGHHAAVKWSNLNDAKKDEVKADLGSALQWISDHHKAYGYPMWQRQAARLKSLGDEGYPLWIAFSELKPEEYDPVQAEDTWWSAKCDRTGHAAIFTEAQKLGWVNPQKGKKVHGAANFRVGPAAPFTPGLSFLEAASGPIAATLPMVVDTLQGPEMGVRVQYDEFVARPVISYGAEALRCMTDRDQGRLRTDMQRRGFKPIGPEIMKTALGLVADANRFDSAKQWAQGLVWDGVPRVSTALCRYFGCSDTPYTQAVARYVFTALAGRALEPGCQADMVPVLVGLQGVGKTSAVRALAPLPDTFVEIDLSKRDDDLSRRLRGKLVAEWPELRGLHGREVTAVRAWITSRWESWIEKYEAHETKYGRRFLVIGTANEKDFLNDGEGERRWLPVEVGTQVDVSGLERDCAQLWAEGAALWAQGGVQWQEAEALAREEHWKFKQVDALTEKIRDWLDAVPPAQPFGQGGGNLPRSSAPFTIYSIAKECLGYGDDRIDMRLQKRIGHILRSLNYEKRSTWLDGKSSNCWHLKG